MLTHGVRDLRSLPLGRRKACLRSLVPVGATSVLLADGGGGQGIPLFDEACARDLEGIVAKRRADPYDSARPWVKIKNPHYSQAAGRRELFDAKRRR